MKTPRTTHPKNGKTPGKRLGNSQYPTRKDKGDSGKVQPKEKAKTQINLFKE